MISKKKKKKKKKKVFAKIQSDFSPKFRKFKRLRGGSFRMGGDIFHFSQKIGLKSTKYMRFCILHKPTPPPWLRYWIWQRCIYSIMVLIVIKVTLLLKMTVSSCFHSDSYILNLFKAKSGLISLRFFVAAPILF